MEDNNFIDIKYDKYPPASVDVDIDQYMKSDTYKNMMKNTIDQTENREENYMEKSMEDARKNLVISGYIHPEKYNNNKEVYRTWGGYTENIDSDKTTEKYKGFSNAYSKTKKCRGCDNFYSACICNVNYGDVKRG